MLDALSTRGLPNDSGEVVRGDAGVRAERGRASVFLLLARQKLLVSFDGNVRARRRGRENLLNYNNVRNNGGEER